MTTPMMPFEEALAKADTFDATQAKAALHDFMVLCRAGLEVKNAFREAVGQLQTQPTISAYSPPGFSGRLQLHLPTCDCSFCVPESKK